MESHPAMAWRPFRNIGLKRALRELNSIRGSRLPEALARRLIAGWGAPDAVKPAFLIKCFEIASRTTGTILECGSGITTIVLAVGAKGRPAGIVSLESDAYARRQALEKLRFLGLKHADVRETPMRSYGSFDWYAVDGSFLRRPIAAVICHGPNASAHRREHLLHVLGHCLPADCTILTEAENPTES